MSSITVRELVTKLGFKVDPEGIQKGDALVEKFKKGVKLLAVGTGAAISGIGALALKAAGDMEMLTTQFEVMLGSSEKAAKLMKELKEFSAATPFGIQTLAKNTQQLLAFGVAEEDVLKTLTMLGDTAGGDAEKLNGLTLAYGKVVTKGKASLEEINMMAERGLPIFNVLAKNMGVSREELFKLISAGKVGQRDIAKAFQVMTSEGGLFFKGMEKQSQTFSGIISTMKDNISLAAAELGSKLLPFAKEAALRTITMAKAVKEWIAAFDFGFITGGLVIIQKHLQFLWQTIMSSGVREALEVLVFQFNKLGVTVFNFIVGEGSGLAEVLKFIGNIVGFLITSIINFTSTMVALTNIIASLVPALDTLVGIMEALVPLFVVLFGAKAVLMIKTWLLQMKAVPVVLAQIRAFMIASTIAGGGQITMLGLLKTAWMATTGAITKAAIAMKAFVASNPALAAMAALALAVGVAVKHMNDTIDDTEKNRDLINRKEEFKELAGQRLYTAKIIKRQEDRLKELRAQGRTGSPEFLEEKARLERAKAAMNRIKRQISEFDQKKSTDPLTVEDLNVPKMIADLQKQAATRQVKQNIKINNEINVDAPRAEDDTTTLNPDGVAKAVDSVFNRKLREVLVTQAG
jgi:tape measure domain-containing protein